MDALWGFFRNTMVQDGNEVILGIYLYKDISEAIHASETCGRKK